MFSKSGNVRVPNTLQPRDVSIKLCTYVEYWVNVLFYFPLVFFNKISQLKICFIKEKKII